MPPKKKKKEASANKNDIPKPKRTGDKPGIIEMVKEIIPSCFYLGRPDPDLPDERVRMQDAIQDLKGIYHTSSLETTHDLAGAMLKPMLSAIGAPGSKIEIYAIIFDKGQYTPLAKGGEQLKRKTNDEIRDLNKYNKLDPESQMKLDEMKLDSMTDNPDWLKLPHILPPEKGSPLPPNYLDLLKDRRAVQKIIADLVTIWISAQDNACSIRIPQGKTVIIDGHALSRERLEKLGIKVPSSIVNTYDVPIKIHRPFSSTHFCEFLMATELTNQIGEFDFSSFYIYRRLLDAYKKPLNLVIASTDSDTLILSLLMIALRKTKYLEESKIWWKRSDNKWIYESSKPNASPTYEKWVDVTGIANAIQKGKFDIKDIHTYFYQQVFEKGGATKANMAALTTAFSEGKVRQPIVNFVALAVCHGGDYLKKIKGINIDRYMHCLVEDPVKYGTMVSMKKDEKNATDVTLNNDVLHQLIWSARDKCKSKPKLDGDELCRFASQYYYYLLLIAQIGDDRMALWEGDPLIYGYGSSNHANIQRANIFRKSKYFETDAESYEHVEDDIEERLEKGKTAKPRASKKKKVAEENIDEML